MTARIYTNTRADPVLAGKAQSGFTWADKHGTRILPMDYDKPAWNGWLRRIFGRG